MLGVDDVKMKQSKLPIYRSNLPAASIRPWQLDYSFCVTARITLGNSAKQNTRTPACNFRGSKQKTRNKKLLFPLPTNKLPKQNKYLPHGIHIFWIWRITSPKSPFTHATTQHNSQNTNIFHENTEVLNRQCSFSSGVTENSDSVFFGSHKSQQLHHINLLNLVFFCSNTFWIKYFV